MFLMHVVIFCLLLITRRMIREAAPDQISIFFVAPLIALLLNKLRLVALYLLSNLAIYRFVKAKCLSFVLKMH